MRSIIRQADQFAYRYAGGDCLPGQPCWQAEDGVENAFGAPKLNDQSNVVTPEKSQRVDGTADMIGKPSSDFAQGLGLGGGGGGGSAPSAGGVGSSAGGSGGSSGGSANGLLPGAAGLRDQLLERFPGADIGGYNGTVDQPWDEHGTGKALDFMVGDDANRGNEVKDYALQNGANYVLWQQQQWNPDGSVTPMDDRGSPTENHMDHPHINIGKVLAYARRVLEG